MSLRILAISGSLRMGSGNTALLQAAAQLAPSDLEMEIYTTLAHLPHFNPDLDLDGMKPPEAVAVLRERVGSADGILISTPEYAHGLPGSLKNALDWLVSSSEFVHKPVALFNASSRSTFAQASLVETLRIMTARLIPEATLSLSLLGRNLPPNEIASDPESAASIRAALALFTGAIRVSSKAS
jgi:chromate reductase, NAD(P)H dehydrogenase (quinone)